MTQRLLHYSAKPLSKLCSVSAEQIRLFEGGVFKPLGLWVSVEGEDDWPSWCKNANAFHNDLTYVTEIVLQPNANVLRICGAKELDEFHERYPMRYADTHRPEYIDWPRVATDYDGIIIAPYVWERRLDFKRHWYYTWDCASGCIWNADAIRAKQSILLAGADA